MKNIIILTLLQGTSMAVQKLDDSSLVALDTDRYHHRRQHAKRASRKQWDPQSTQGYSWWDDDRCNNVDKLINSPETPTNYYIYIGSKY